MYHVAAHTHTQIKYILSKMVTFQEGAQHTQDETINYKLAEQNDSRAFLPRFHKHRRRDFSRFSANLIIFLSVSLRLQFMQW